MLIRGSFGVISFFAFFWFYCFLSVSSCFPVFVPKVTVKGRSRGRGLRNSLKRKREDGWKELQKEVP